jgi:hypothetical protein
MNVKSGNTEYIEYELKKNISTNILKVHFILSPDTIIIEIFNRLLSKINAFKKQNYIQEIRKCNYAE